MVRDTKEFSGTSYLIIAYQTPSHVWRHPYISGYGGQRLPNVTQRDLPLPQARFHSALVRDLFKEVSSEL